MSSNYDNLSLTQSSSMNEKAIMTEQRTENDFRKRLLFIQEKINELESIDRKTDPLKFDIVNSDLE